MTLSALQVLDPRPVREPVPGAPYQPGDLVTVVAAVDIEVHDVTSYIGRRGRVAYLEDALAKPGSAWRSPIAGRFGNPLRVSISISCGCGQSYPDDPMVGVDLDGGVREEFWKEELRMGGGCSLDGGGTRYSPVDTRF